MQQLLDRTSQLVRTRPIAIIAALVVLTVALGAVAATRIEMGVDIADYGTGTELAEAFDEIAGEFGARNDAVTVLVEAGDDRSVLDRTGLELAARLDDAVRSSPAAEVLSAETAFAPAVLSWSLPVHQGLAAVDADIDDLPDAALGELVAQAYDSPGAARAIGLLSDDADVAQADARAGIAIVRFGPGTTEDERAEASLAVGRALAEIDEPGFRILAFNQALLSEELEGSLADELPLLMAIATAVVIGVLALALRRLSDVLLTLASVLMTLVWLFGIVALLGPGVTGLTGPYRQVSIAVPVLLIGLSVDYSFHLTMRQREERAGGAGAGDAAGTAVRTVGRALVLVTLTTAVGFLANVISPLPPIVDFAIFAGAGIVATLVVMGLFIPSARHLLDRGRDAREVPDEQTGRVVSAMAAMARSSTRRPVAVLSTIVVLAALGVVAALDLETEFDQEQFLPDDTTAAALLDVAQDRFGGGVTEQTWVLVEGDVTDPALAQSVLVAQQEMADIDHVDTAEGEAQVQSPPGAVAQLAALAGADLPAGDLPADLGEQLGARGWTGEGFSPDADVAGLYELVDAHLPGQLERTLADDRSRLLLTVDTSAGDEHVDALVADLRTAIAPIEQAGGETTVVSEELLTQETLTALADSQVQKIAFTVVAAGALLVLYYGLARRQAALGFITLVPTLLALPLVLGGMWLTGFGFNALTATIAAIAIGFGVDYGIHLSNRFAEERERTDDVAEAVHGTIVHTGAALVASAATSAGGFAVLLLADIEPLRQFGAITAMTIVVALVATLFAETSALVLWDRRQRAHDPT